MAPSTTAQFASSYGKPMVLSFSKVIQQVLVTLGYLQDNPVQVS
jgi:hypothetical protein